MDRHTILYQPALVVKSNKTPDIVANSEKAPSDVFVKAAGLLSKVSKPEFNFFAKGGFTPSDATQLNRTVLLRRVVDVFTPSNATHQNCLVEMRRSRVHTNRLDSTKRFRCVTSFGVNTLMTRDDQFSPVFQILNISVFGQLSCVGS